jgi:hypothetical protein
MWSNCLTLIPYFPQLVVPVYKIFLHKYLHYSVRNMYTKFQPKLVGCGHAMTWMSRPHPSWLSNQLLMCYARIPTNHGPVTTCDNVPCALLCDGSVVTRTHVLPSQSEFSDMNLQITHYQSDSISQLPTHLKDNMVSNTYLMAYNLKYMA